MLHFDSKALVGEYLREQKPRLAAVTRHLQVGLYMSNVLIPMLLPRKAASDGVYEFRWANITPAMMLNAVCPERDTGVFINALQTAPAGAVLLGKGDPQTVDSLLKTWSEVTGHVARPVPISKQELEAAIGPVMPSLGRESAEIFQYYRDFTHTGGDPVVKRPSGLGVDVGQLTTYRQYLGGID